jgi:molybdate transport system ATP-binding protein
MLYVTHNVGEALTLAETVLLLRKGSVEAHGPALDLLTRPAMSSAVEAGIENLLHGEVVAHDETAGITRVLLDDGTPLTVPLVAGRRPRGTVDMAIRAEDIVVSVEPCHGLSARNVVEVRIGAADRVGHDVLLRCRPVSAGETDRRPWLVRVTPAAVDALGLADGRVVWLAIKSHSVRIL